MYSIGRFLCAIQTNRWAFAFCASLGPGFLVGKRGKKSTIYILYCMFADDTYITTAHEEISTIECSLNSDLIAVHNWLKTNKLSCNTSKTSYMTIGSRQNLANAKFMNLELDNRPIEHKPY